MRIGSIFFIVKKEIMDNVRNKWIILISVLFASLTLLVSYAGSIFNQGWQDLGFTVSGMSSLVQLLISIIGLMLGYAAIVGEIERGSMSSLLTLPTTRNEILFGKFLGLGSVLTFTIVVGFGIAGIVIGINVPNVDYSEYLIFIIASILMGLVFLSLGLFLSCLFKRRSTAMGGAIFLWFLFSIIWRFIVGAVLIFTTASEEIGSFSFPDWYFGLQIFNPLDAYSALVTLNIGSVRTLQQEIGDIIYPSFYKSEVMVLILIIWLVISFFLAFWRFKQRDI